MRTLVLQLVGVLFVGVAVVSAIALLVVVAGGSSAAFAFARTFYVSGGLLVLFALLTHGAEGRGGAMGIDIFTERIIALPPEACRLNPTGALVLTAPVLLGLGVAVEAAT